MMKRLFSLVFVAILSASAPAANLYVDIVWHVPSLPPAIRHTSIPVTVAVFEMANGKNIDRSTASLYLGGGYGYTYHTLDLPAQGSMAWGISVPISLQRRGGYDGKYYLIRVSQALKVNITNHTEVIQIYLDAWIDPNQED